MSFPDNPADQIVWLVNEIAEIKRRDRNRKRTGKIAEVDLKSGLAKVEFHRHDGTAYVSGWLPWKEVAAGGIKSHIPPSAGEQVDVVSESGDLTDAIIDMSTPSDENPRPHDGPEAVLEMGNSRFMIGSDEIRMVSGKIVLDADVHLGGEGGKLLHRKGDGDSAGDTAVGSASRVFAV